MLENMVYTNYCAATDVGFYQPSYPDTIGPGASVG
jgi:hypothetical protein